MNIMLANIIIGKQLHLPYSLEITPPSIISPLYFLLKYAAEVYLSLI